MKKVAFLVLIIILLLMLCSCSKYNRLMGHKSYENKVEKTRFIIIESYDSGNIIVDSETNVEYWMSKGAYNTGTLTMLVNESGNPKVRKR